MYDQLIQFIQGHRKKSTHQSFSSYFRATNCNNSCLCPQIRNVYSFKAFITLLLIVSLLHTSTDSSLKSGTASFWALYLLGRKVLNECWYTLMWLNTNLPLLIGYGGVTQFLAYALGCKAGKVSIFGNITLTISGKANMKLEYTGSRPFLSPPR